MAPTTILALAALVLGAATAPTLAAPGERATGTVAASLDESAITREVLAKGFAEISALRHEGGRYHVEAVRPNGAVFELVLDAHDGRVVEENRGGWARGTIPPAPLGPTAGFRSGF